MASPRPSAVHVPVLVLVLVPVLVLVLGLSRAAWSQEDAPDPDGPSLIVPYEPKPQDDTTPAPARTDVTGLKPDEATRPLHVVRAGEGRRGIDQWAVLFFVATLILLAGGMVLAWQCLAMALFPVLVDRARDAARDRPWLSIMLGIPNAGGLVLVAGVGAALQGAGVLLSLVATAAFFGMAVVGLAGRAQTLGSRLVSPERADSRLATLTVGWAVMLGVAAVPFVGWVVGIWWLVGALGSTAVAVLGAILSPSTPAGPGPTPAARP